jgi:hypothetical protein
MRMRNTQGLQAIALSNYLNKQLVVRLRAADDDDV